MKLIATKAMLYDGRNLSVGDEFETSDRNGRLLKAIRKAEDATEPSVPPEAQPPADPLDHDGDGKKGGSKKGGSKKGVKYNRRDMRAKD